MENDPQQEGPTPSGLDCTGDIDMDNLNRLLVSVGALDERGLILSLAAFAEDTLGRLLLTYLRDGKQSKELIDGFNAPLGTLSTRIKAAYAIGLLTREQYEDLEIARKVRNAFAHDWEGVTMDRADIKGLVSQMHAYSFDLKPFVGNTKERLLQSMTSILIELRIQITQHRKHQRRVPEVAFRLTSLPPEQWNSEKWKLVKMP